MGGWQGGRGRDEGRSEMLLQLVGNRGNIGEGERFVSNTKSYWWCEWRNATVQATSGAKLH